ncbi:hypothetical protein KCU65_g4855, partial [Aureobasidium melanogenum]
MIPHAKTPLHLEDPVQSCRVTQFGGHRCYILHDRKSQKRRQTAKRTAAGIPTSSPTVVLICRSTAYVWQSGRDAQFSADCGRTC